MALMLSANPKLTPEQVKDILRKTADDIDTQGFDDRTGAGRVNAFRAVKMAQSLLKKQKTPKPKEPVNVQGSGVISQEPQQKQMKEEWENVLD